MGGAQCPFCRRFYTEEVKAKIVAMASKHKSEPHNIPLKHNGMPKATKVRKKLVNTHFPEPSLIKRVDVELKLKCGEKVNSLDSESRWKTAVEAYLGAMKNYERLFELAEEAKEYETFAYELAIELMEVSSVIVEWQRKTEREIADLNYWRWVESYDKIQRATTCTMCAKIQETRLLALKNESKSYRIDNIWTHIAVKNRMTIQDVDALKRSNPALPSPLAYMCNPTLAKRKIGQASSALQLRPRQGAKKCHN